MKRLATIFLLLVAEDKFYINAYNVASCQVYKKEFEKYCKKAEITLK